MHTRLPVPGTSRRLVCLNSKHPGCLAGQRSFRTGLAFPWTVQSRRSNQTSLEGRWKQEHESRLMTNVELDTGASELTISAPMMIRNVPWTNLMLRPIVYVGQDRSQGSGEKKGQGRRELRPVRLVTGWTIQVSQASRRNFEAPKCGERPVAPLPWLPRLHAHEHQPASLPACQSGRRKLK